MSIEEFVRKLESHKFFLFLIITSDVSYYYNSLFLLSFSSSSNYQSNIT